MKNDVFGSKPVLISALALILVAGTAHAANNLMRVRAEVNDSAVSSGDAVFTECLFANASHVDTVESTLTASVRFADGSAVVPLASQTHEFGPGEAFIFRSAVLVEEDTALGTAVWAFRAESTIVGGPRPLGQMAVDSDAATFEVFDAAGDF